MTFFHNNIPYIITATTSLLVITGFIEYWAVSKQKMKLVFSSYILSALLFFSFNMLIAFNGEGQEGVMIFNILAAWKFCIGVRGLFRCFQGKPPLKEKVT